MAVSPITTQIGPKSSSKEKNRKKERKNKIKY
jgi:hypothetical protein